MTILPSSSALNALAAALCLVGCSSESPTGGEPTSANTSTSATATSALPIPADGVGKPACDSYVMKMRACIDKLPESERTAKKQVLDATLAAWREQAQKPEMEKNLETTCTAAMRALESDPLCK